ncbi:hypothetical protein X011_02160 [Mycobacterium tuberculosis variant microti OV254]|nr:hypothetical protein X011_02160 [Mycobacterium tuberculosis variant microti OV254]
MNIAMSSAVMPGCRPPACRSRVVNGSTNQVVLVGEVAVERGGADAGPAGDLLQARLGSLLVERLAGRGNQLVSIALHVLAGRPDLTALYR